MRVIGVTGAIGSGKSYISSLFAKRGIPVIDTDEVYHSLVNTPTQTTSEIAEEFGVNVLNSDGSLNRIALAEIVFSNKAKLERLNEITHSRVKEVVLKELGELEKNGEKAVVLEVPLMFESGFDKLCDEIVCVVASEQTRVQRLMSRNGFSEAEAKKRIKNQKDSDFYIEKSTKIVYNETYEAANARFEEIFGEILGL